MQQKITPSPLSATESANLRTDQQSYPLRVPSHWRQRIDWQNSQDPLLRQIQPTPEEWQPVAGFSEDPLAEEQAQPLPGLLHKYAGRALLLLSHSCPIHCRYCFRRHSNESKPTTSAHNWQAAVEWIKQEKTIREIIYSGGDPLMLPDRQLQQLTRQLAEIPHLQRLRVHSRMPVVTPKRIGHDLLQWLTGSRLTPVLVIHCNHPQELDSLVLQALHKLQQAGVLLLNQSVLLKGINDSVEVLAALCETLIHQRILPYYLHQLDPVAGAAHFRVDNAKAAHLWLQLQSRLPGYALPRLVWEQPGYPSKRLLELPDDAHQDSLICS
ncbi:EF-P beta-lysylation protein EpmB [Candidatus Magnetaquicoccus inordinatus]|uniref:EF-P beta-lysylation protein EpmB n=1 Tax=Candidatus Magnetaquicoccus inordinatus TaxID=2496818 RepID=UPI001D0F02E1|nr:EF-P beta-lysylation protein EpmB [Candidatus Magnetaquicoccus inordinatus]